MLVKIRNKELLSSDPDIFPEVTYPGIVNYLIFNPSPYTKDDLKSYKGLAAYNQFLMGWVREVGVKVYGPNILVKAKVLLCFDIYLTQW